MAASQPAFSMLPVAAADDARDRRAGRGRIIADNHYRSLREPRLAADPLIMDCAIRETALQSPSAFESQRRQTSFGRVVGFCIARRRNATREISRPATLVRDRSAGRFESRRVERARGCIDDYERGERIRPLTRHPPTHRRGIPAIFLIVEV